MNKFKDKMMRFMQGRYGSDQLARLTMYISFACLIVTIFWHNTFIYFLALVLLIYTYFRMLSRNISRRYNENQIYLKYRYKVIAKFNGFKARMRDRKTHRVFKCPGCSQKIRVPRGKGSASLLNGMSPLVLMSRTLSVSLLALIYHKTASDMSFLL